MSEGDLLVLRETAEFPLEWAIVAPARLGDSAAGRPAVGGGAAADEAWLVVPADTNPATGSGDLRIPARAATGPLTLRCGFAVRVPMGLLAGGVVSGSLELGDLGRAREKVDAHLGPAASRATGSPLERETDGDPEYLDWIESTIAPAARALEAAATAWNARRLAEPAAPGGGGGNADASGGAGGSGQEAIGGADPSGGALRFAPRRRRALSPPRWAVAALLALSLGLSWSTFSLWRQVERLSRPLFDPPSGEVLLGGPNRDPLRQPIRVKVPPGASHILLTVVLGSNLPAHTLGRLEIQTVTGRSLWSSPAFALKPADERGLVLSRDLVPGRRYLLVLYGQSGPDGPVTVPLERRYLELEPLP
jgi:hypothetical protein